MVKKQCARPWSNSWV